LGEAGAALPRLLPPKWALICHYLGLKIKKIQNLFFESAAVPRFQKTSFGFYLMRVP